MPERPSDLQEFLDLTGDGLAQWVPPSNPAAAVAQRIHAALQQPRPLDGATVPSRLSACSHLATAVANARRGAPAVGALAEAFQALAPRLTWTRRPGSAAIDDDFRDNHANALIAGPGGVEPRDDVSVGVTLMAPDTRYPDHHHPPEEVYLVLSPGEWRQGDGPWHAPGPGGIVHNTPDIIHAMRSGAAPVLAVWCLWTKED